VSCLRGRPVRGGRGRRLVTGMPGGLFSRRSESRQSLPGIDGIGMRTRCLSEQRRVTLDTKRLDPHDSRCPTSPWDRVPSANHGRRRADCSCIGRSRPQEKHRGFVRVSGSSPHRRRDAWRRSLNSRTLATHDGIRFDAATASALVFSLIRERRCCLLLPLPTPASSLPAMMPGLFRNAGMPECRNPDLPRLPRRIFAGCKSGLNVTTSLPSGIAAGPASLGRHSTGSACDGSRCPGNGSDPARGWPGLSDVHRGGSPAAGSSRGRC